MFSNHCLIKPTLHYFYIVFDYFLFLELHLNQYKLLLFIQLFFHQILFLEFQCDWSKKSFKLFSKSFFCWMFTCVYHIYWIIVHWYWNLSLGVIENCQWSISKPDMRICFPCRFVEGCGEVSGFCDLTYCHEYIDWLQGN